MLSELPKIVLSSPSISIALEACPSYTAYVDKMFYTDFFVILVRVYTAASNLFILYELTKKKMLTFGQYSETREQNINCRLTLIS